jgi:CRP/FNR family transcriptional regulator
LRNLHEPHFPQIRPQSQGFCARDATLNLGKGRGPMVFDLPLTREAMADYLGLTLETVSRQISALKRDGVIHLEAKRHVTVPDFARLMEEAGDDSDGGMLV